MYVKKDYPKWNETIVPRKHVSCSTGYSARGFIFVGLVVKSFWVFNESQSFSRFRRFLCLTTLHCLGALHHLQFTRNCTPWVCPSFVRRTQFNSERGHCTTFDFFGYQNAKKQFAPLFSFSSAFYSVHCGTAGTHIITKPKPNFPKQHARAGF